MNDFRDYEVLDEDFDRIDGDIVDYYEQIDAQIRKDFESAGRYDIFDDHFDKIDF